MDSDQNIVAGCVWGDRDAWDQLVRRNENLVYSACALTGGREETRGAFQDVFMKVLVALPSYNPQRGTFSGWLRAVTRSVLVDHWRRKACRREVAHSDGNLDSLPDLREGPKRRNKHDAATVRNAIERLPRRLREAVVSHYYSDLKYREISELLDLPEGTVKVRPHRSHARLLTRLSQEFRSWYAFRISAGLGLGTSYSNLGGRSNRGNP